VGISMRLPARSLFAVAGVRDRVPSAAERVLMQERRSCCCTLSQAAKKFPPTVGFHAFASRGAGRLHTAMPRASPSSTATWARRRDG
jgi:hypothetical protein